MVMIVEFAHRTRAPWDALETAEDEAAREQAEADFDAGELLAELLDRLPDDFLIDAVGAVVAEEGMQPIIRLLGSANNERLWKRFMEAREKTIREACE